MSSSPFLRVLVIGNGAHLTGAPRSLLEIVSHRPSHVLVQAYLLGGGPLLSSYANETASLRVFPVPATRGLQPRRMWEELRLASNLLWAALRHPRPDIVVVNTIEYEAALLVCVFHRGRARLIIREDPRYLSGARGRLRRLFLRLAKPNVAFVSEGQARAWSSHLPAVPITVIPNIVQTSARRRHALLPPRTGPLRFLLVGAHRRIKGAPEAIAAFARMHRRKDAELVLIGDDPHRESGAVQADLPGVRSLSPVANLADVMGELADVLLALSPQETFGRTVVEAAFHGMPSLAWKGNRVYGELVPPLKGQLVATWDISALASAMDTLVAMPHDAFRQYRERVREAASTIADPEVVAKQWWDWILDGRVHPELSPATPSAALR